MSELLHTVWAEKYRPTELKDCVYPEHIMNFCKKIIEDNELPNLLLYSKAPGVGKTTLAYALCNEFDYDVLEINGSSDRNIDTLRGEITSFVTSFSLNGKRKVVLIDEADYLNAQSTQPALRNFIQEFSSNCSFIFTCNYINRLIEPLRDRFFEISFDYDKKDEKHMMVSMHKRACLILEQENVTFDPSVVAKYVKNGYPSFRDILITLQGASKLGPIDKVNSVKKDNKQVLIEIIKGKKFKDMRIWAAENQNLGMEWVANTIYTNLDTLFKNEDQPLAIQLVYDYLYKDKFAVNPEICIAACLSEIFLSC